MLHRRALVVALAAMATGIGLIRPAAADQTLDAPTAFQQLQAGTIVLVDIRQPEEWAATGSPEGAHRLDMRRPDFVSALSALVDDDPTRQIALICAGGVRSARMSRALADAGFTRVADVPEGMLGSWAGPGWLARGLPVVSD